MGPVRNLDDLMALGHGYQRAMTLLAASEARGVPGARGRGARRVRAGAPGRRRSPEALRPPRRPCGPRADREKAEIYRNRAGRAGTPAPGAAFDGVHPPPPPRRVGGVGPPVRHGPGGADASRGRGGELPGEFHPGDGGKRPRAGGGRGRRILLRRGIASWTSAAGRGHTPSRGPRPARARRSPSSTRRRRCGSRGRSCGRRERTGGCASLEGDFLKDPLGGPYDFVWISQILHAYSGADCVKLLRRARSALVPGGRWRSRSSCSRRGRPPRRGRSSSPSTWWR